MPRRKSNIKKAERKPSKKRTGEDSVMITGPNVVARDSMVTSVFYWNDCDENAAVCQFI